MDRSRNSFERPCAILHLIFTSILPEEPSHVSTLVHDSCYPYFWKRIMNYVAHTRGCALRWSVDSIMRANSKKINDQLSDARKYNTSRKIVDSEIKCPRQETSARAKMLEFRQESRKARGNTDYRGLAAPFPTTVFICTCHQGGGEAVENQKPLPLELFIRSSRVSGPHGVGRL